MRSVLNWVEVGTYLSSGGRTQTEERNIDVCFRDGIVAHSLSDRQTVWGLILYHSYSRDMGVYSKHDISALMDIATDVNRNLRNTFNQEEITRCSTGGGFGAKEALLFILMRKLKPHVVVETGVAQGISSYVILSALSLNFTGSLISIDLPNYNPGGYVYSDGTTHPAYVPKSLGTGWMVPEGLRNRWSLKIGKSETILPSIAARVDVFFHDSEHSYHNMTFEFEWAYSHLSESGILLSDDYKWNGAFNDFLSNHSDMKQFWKDMPIGCAAKHPFHENDRTRPHFLL